MQQITLSHIDLPLYAACFRDVKNAAFLREQLLNGNQDFQYAFVDARLVLSKKQVLAAAFRAILNYQDGELKSHNVHSELVFALNPTNNIGEAFRRFGIQEDTKDIVVLKVATDPSVTLADVQAHLGASIEGQECVFEDEIVRPLSDLTRIRKVYKLNNSNIKPSKMVNGNAQLQDHDFESVEAQILGMMALRGAA